MTDDTTTHDPDDAPEQKPFAVFLQEHKRGLLANELARELQEVVAAVIEHGKKGSVTLKLDVSPSKDGMTVFVTDDVKANKPKADRGGSIMFPDAKGNLHRSDPNQMRLERFHVVETKNEEPVVVDTHTGEIKEVN